MRNDRCRPHPLFCVGVLLWLVLPGCSGCNDSSPDPQFPAEMVGELLDAPTESAEATIMEHYPDAHALSGALRMVDIRRSQWLSRVIVFGNVRSGRVGSVVLKYRAELSDEQKLTVVGGLVDSDLVQRAQAGETVESPWRQSTLRLRWADKQGQLTITVE